MPLYEYTAVADNNGGQTETGRIVANDKLDAFDKLKRRELRLVGLKKIEGLAAFFQKRSADIK